MNAEPLPADTSQDLSQAEKDAHQWGMLIHLSLLLKPSVVGILVPVTLWQMKKDNPIIDAHGKRALNWLVTELLLFTGLTVISFALAATVVLTFLAVLGWLTLGVVALLGIVFPVIAAVKASGGASWKYPIAFRFFR